MGELTFHNSKITTGWASLILKSEMLQISKLSTMKPQMDPMWKHCSQNAGAQHTLYSAFLRGKRPSSTSHSCHRYFLRTPRFHASPPTKCYEMAVCRLDAPRTLAVVCKTPSRGGCCWNGHHVRPAATQSKSHAVHRSLWKIETLCIKLKPKMSVL